MTPGEALGDAERSDLDALLAAALRMARQELEHASAFDPFVLVTDARGALLGADIDRSQLGRHPESAELVETATTQLRGLAPLVRATAITLTTRLAKQRRDAVEVRLDHREGASLVVILPFTRPRFGGRTEYGETVTYRGNHDIWS